MIISQAKIGCIKMVISPSKIQASSLILNLLKMLGHQTSSIIKHQLYLKGLIRETYLIITTSSEVIKCCAMLWIAGRNSFLVLRFKTMGSSASKRIVK